MVDQTFTRSNPMMLWLRNLDALRDVLKSPANGGVLLLPKRSQRLDA